MREFIFTFNWSGKIEEFTITLEDFMKSNPHLSKEEAQRLMIYPFVIGLEIMGKLLSGKEVMR